MARLREEMDRVRTREGMGCVPVLIPCPPFLFLQLSIHLACFASEREHWGGFSFGGDTYIFTNNFESYM